MASPPGPNGCAAGGLEAELAEQLEPLRQWLGAKLEQWQAEMTNLTHVNQDLQKQLAAVQGTSGDIIAANCSKSPVSLGDSSAKFPVAVSRASGSSASLPTSVSSSVFTAGTAGTAVVAKKSGFKYDMAQAKSAKPSDREARSRTVPPMHHWLAAETDAAWHTRHAGQGRSRNRRLSDLISHAMDREISHRSNSFSISGYEIRKLCCSTRTLPLHPNGALRIAWDFMSGLALFFDFVTVPLAAFGITASNTSWLYVAGMAILTYWTLDMVVQCLTGYLTREGRFVRSWRLILKRYCMTWFPIDVMIVGSEWILLIFSQSRTGAQGYARIAKTMRAVRFLRMLRLLRLLRLAKLRELICRVEEYIDSEYISVMWSVIVNLVVLLGMNHVFACLFYWVGSADRDDTWLVVYDVKHASFTDRYLTSLHWSLTQFTPASMAVQPQNTQERAFAVLVILMAMVTFSSFVSSVTAGLTRLRNLQSEAAASKYKLKKFLKIHRISPELAARVYRYIDIALSARKKTLLRSSVKLLSYVSGPLNIELLTEIYSPHLLVYPYFQKLTLNQLRHLCCKAVEMQSTSQRDVIFSRLRCATHFYLLTGGAAAYKVPDFERRGRWIVRVPQGSWFSEAVLWVSWYHQGTMQTLTECDVVTVDVVKFAEVVQSHMTGIADARLYASEFVKVLEHTILVHGRAWDVPYATMRGAGNFNTKGTTKTYNQSQLEEILKDEVTQAETVEAQLLLSESSSEEEDLEPEELQHGGSTEDNNLQEGMQSI